MGHIVVTLMHSILVYYFTYLDHMQEISHLIIMAYRELIMQPIKINSDFNFSFFCQILIFLT